MQRAAESREALRVNTFSADGRRRFGDGIEVERFVWRFVDGVVQGFERGDPLFRGGGGTRIGGFLRAAAGGGRFGTALTRGGGIGKTVSANELAGDAAVFEFRTVAIRPVRFAERVVDRNGVGMEGGIESVVAQLETDGAAAVGAGLGGGEGMRAGEIGSGVDEGDGIDAGRAGLPVLVGEREGAIGGDEAFVVEGKLVDLVCGSCRGADSRIGMRAVIRAGIGWRIEGREARGAGQGRVDDLEGVEGGAGAIDFELMGEEAVNDLRADELNGGVVFDERNGDVGGVGQLGMAVMRVGVAKVGMVEGIVFAAAAVGGESAAAWAWLRVGSRRLGDRGDNVEHDSSLEQCGAGSAGTHEKAPPVR